MKKEFVGIDVSKLTLDVHLHHQRIYCRFSNDHEGFVQLFKWLSDHADKQLNNLFFCLEHTGIYSELLVVYLQEQGQSYAIVSGLEVKRSMGLKRGKSDKTDAQALAKYAYQNQDELRTGMPISKNIKELKELLSLRLRFVREMAGHKAYLREQKKCIKKNNRFFLLLCSE